MALARGPGGAPPHSRRTQRLPAAEDRSAGRIPRLVLPGAGVLLRRARPRARSLLAHPMLQAAARRVAQIFDVKYIVMGHSHRMVEEPVGNSTRYFNLGSWTGRSNDGFPHVVVTGGSAELRRWKGLRSSTRRPIQSLPQSCLSRHKLAS